MWHDGWGWGFAGFWAMLLFMALFWGVIVALVVWAVRQYRPRQEPAAGGGDAMRILEERFARGEIDADEFQRRREILRGGTG